MGQVSSVAVIADVHGVLPALQAVLASERVRAADVLVVCGDVCAGPQPVAVLDLLSGRDDVVLVRGNADRELAAIARGDDDTIRDALPVDLWAARQLDEHHVALLESLPHPTTLDVAGFGPVLFCHGTPRDDEEVVLVDTLPSRWREAFAGLAPEVRTVVCGHTHMPFVRLVDGVTVVNPGSVGMPYGRPGAHWALLDRGGVSLHREDFDLDAAVDAVARDSSFDGARAWAEEYVLARNTDTDAMTAFGPRDGRADRSGQ